MKNSLTGRKMPQKGKVSITPPTSPSSSASFSFQQNGYYNNSFAASPRHMSDSSDPGIDGHFRFLEGYSTDDVGEVFAISDGKVNNDTLSNRSHGSKPGSTAGTLPGARESFPEDKYKWNDTEQSANNEPPKQQTNNRKICLIVFFTILVLALIGVGVAVILVYKVFDVGEAEELVQTTVRPEILCLDGSLDLKETWLDELSNPKSPLYISTANNFILEMDKVMKNSSYSESYIRTEVSGFRPGSIAVNFKMFHDYRYKKSGRTGPQFAGLVKQHLIKSAPQTSLAIDSKTIEIKVCVIVTPTPPTTPDGLPSKSSAAPPRKVVSPLTSDIMSSSVSATPPLTTSTVSTTSASAATSSVTTTASSLVSAESSNVIYTSVSALMTAAKRDLTSTLMSNSGSEEQLTVSSTLTSSESAQLPNIKSTSISPTPSAETPSEPYVVLKSSIAPNINPDVIYPSTSTQLSNLKSSIVSPSISAEPLASPESHNVISYKPSSNLFTAISPSASVEPSSVISTGDSPSVSVDSSFGYNAPSLATSQVPLTVTSTITSPPIPTEVLTLTFTLEYPPMPTEPVTVTTTVFYPSAPALTVTCTAASYSAPIDIQNDMSFAKSPSFSTEQLKITNSLTSHLVAASSLKIKHDEIFHSKPSESLNEKSNFILPSVSVERQRVSSAARYNPPAVELWDEIDNASLLQELLFGAFTIIPSFSSSAEGHSQTVDSAIVIDTTISSLKPSESARTTDNIKTYSASAESSTTPSVTSSVNATVLSSSASAESLTETSKANVPCASKSVISTFISPSVSTDSLSVILDPQTDNSIYMSSSVSANSLTVISRGISPSKSSKATTVTSDSSVMKSVATSTSAPSSGLTASVVSPSASSTLSTSRARKTSTSKAPSSTVLWKLLTSLTDETSASTPSATEPTSPSSSSSSTTFSPTSETNSSSTTAKMVTTPATKTTSSSTSRLSSSTTKSSTTTTKIPSTTSRRTTTPTSTATTTSSTTTTTTTPTSTSTTSSSTTSTTSPSTTSTTSTTTPTSTTTATSSSTTSTTTSTTETSTTTPTSTTTTTTSTTPSTTTPTTTTSTTSTTTKPTTTTEPDRPPVADAGSDITISLPKNTAVLDGSGSTDDNGITSYHWEKLSPRSVDIDMKGADTKTLSVSNLVEGTFVFRLTVTDKAGQTDRDMVTVTVAPTTTSTTSSTPKPELCSPVNFEMCSSRGFTKTTYPNFFNHMTASEAEEAFNITVQPVINQICQETAINYMCSVFFPKCNPDTGSFILPCRSLCTASQETCGNYFQNPFPCQYFPDSECVALPTTTPPPTPTTTAPIGKCEPTLPESCRQLGFTETMFPNFFREPTQDGAMETFTNYIKPFIDGGCHKDALYFVCSFQFPKCVNGLNIKPCRRTCEAVTAACVEIAAFFPCNQYKELDCIAPPEPTAEPTPKSFKRECSKNEFTCGRVTKCLSRDKVCNGVNDCGDWTDERDCECSEYEYQCDWGMCIKSYQRCDGEAQCPDSSDEKNCEGCTHGAVKCSSGECIMAEWVCDGRPECKDGSDEYDCDVCGYNQFTCADRNHTCIDLSKKCDGREDCPEGYDEWDCINHEKGILEIAYQKHMVPICAAFWDDSYGDYTCTYLLGEGAYINKTDIAYNLHYFAKLSAAGQEKSVLGPWELTYDCPESKALRINCEPRGCGKRMIETLSPDIVNGENALPGDWPWHVALYFGGQYFCGGTLISDTFVLTAAHCVEKFNRDFSLMTVKLGANNRAAKEITQHVIKVEAIESHTDHVYFKRNDIAVLQLDEPVTFTDYIQPICLPEPGDPLPLHSTCFTVGWGKTKWDGDYAEVLQELKMTLWDTKKCNSSIAWNGEIYDTFLCAGYYSGVRSICKKDSGGPLLCLDKTKTWKLRGINSYVGNYCNMTERPNVFTNVSMFSDWLHEKIDCKFRCDNGKCLYYTEQLCDRVDHCGDNSDEIRPCNRTVSCDFEDVYLCGYEFSGWKLGYDNKYAATVEFDGQTYTRSSAPQFDHTVGRFPGQFFYGKQKGVRDAELWSPRFNTSGQTCIRFAYYVRGSIKLGLDVYLYEYRRGGGENDHSPPTRPWSSGTGFASNSLDEWKTGYFDITLGEFKLNFRTGDLLSTAVDDVDMIPGMCSNVLCKEGEFRCRNRNAHNHKCIAKELHCNLAIDCEDEDDENTCTQETNSYICTFENGNLCALYQEVGDASDWWLVNASFVRDELANRAFVDHTSMTGKGFLFYINAYSLQTSSNHIYMGQLFYLRSKAYCFSFYYQMKSKVNFKIHVDCQGCTLTTHMAESTFEEKWTLFQIDLPAVNIVNITYDVEGTQTSDSFARSYIALDDIVVKPGACPKYVCPINYTKCKSYDRCIPKSTLCDRKVDCLDESDEEQCVCASDEFKCASGRCIPQIYKCDRVAQCRDSSDEGDVCQALQSVSCTFEHPYMCGYSFLHYNNFRWERYQGDTDTHFTGPEGDHTFTDGSGHYMYTEADHGKKGDNASFISPVFATNFNQSVLFYYHMYSFIPGNAKPGEFKVSIENLQTQEEYVAWRADPDDLKDYWREGCAPLPNFSKIRLWFIVNRTEATLYGVDIAIDDVSIISYPCKELATTQPPPPPPTGTTTTTTRITTQGSTCKSDEFECDDTTCIKKAYRCDGEPDCPDNSDEFRCIN